MSNCVGWIQGAMRAATRVLRWAVSSVLLGLAAGPASVASTAVVGDLPKEYSIDVLQVEDGLPGNTVTSIAQTPDGYLWFGTFQGLVRFDGVRFTVFDSTTPGLESERATRLFVDRAGSLWVTMEQGQVARYADGRFTPLTKTDGWPGLAVKWMANSAENTVLITVGADDFGPRILLEYAAGRFREVLSKPPVPPEIVPTRGSVGDTVVEVDTTGRRWVVQDRRLGFLERGRWQPWTPPAGEPVPTIARIAASPRGGIWVCAEGRIRRLVDGRWSTDTPTFAWPKENVVMELMEDSAGQLWVGSWSKGLMLGRPDGSTEWLTTGRGFTSNTANCVFEDREHNVWVGTTAGGLLRLRHRDFSTYDQRHGLPTQPAMAIANGADEVWLGVTAGGLWRLAGGRSAPIELPGAPDPTVRSLCFDRGGTLWSGLHGNSLFRHRAGETARYDREQGLSHEIIYALFEDRDGMLWIGGDKGVSRFDGRKFETLTKRDGLSSDLVSAIAQDRDGAVWLGTFGSGLDRFHAGRFQTFTRREGLAHDTVRALLADDDGTLWIGTGGGGLSRLRDGRFTTYSARTGLPGNEISAVLDDGLGQLWLASNRGVFRVARAELEAFADGRRNRLEGVTYLPADGLAAMESAAGNPSAVRDREGRLWFASVKGVSMVDPRKLRTNLVPPTAVIEEVWLDGVCLLSNGSLDGDASRIQATTPYRVPPGKQRLEIRYTGLSHIAPERVRFRHRLTGLDQGWEEAGSRRTATYHLLAPGDYHFEVMARNHDGVWSPVAAAWDFSVLPEWRQTLWFRSGAGLFLLAGGLAAYRMRIRTLTRARVQQEVFSRRLIASQESERQRIARELHDSLGQNLLVIKCRVALAQQQSAQPEKLAEQLGEAAAMTSSAIREVREISQGLRPFQLDELGLGQALEAVVRKLAAATPIRFVAEIAELRGVFPPEFEISFYRIVQECLNNVVKHSKAGECRVLVADNGSQVRAEITDNGRGLAGGDRRHGPAAAEGFGLTSIRERVRTLGGTVEFTSRPEGGTRVVVVVPRRP